MRLTQKRLKELIELFESNRHLFSHFMKGVADFFIETPIGKDMKPAVIHQVRQRLKNIDHLAEKIKRKWDPNNPITPDNFFEKITDIGGVRVIYTAPSQFSYIYEAINAQITAKEWYLVEKPTLYYWDEEVKVFFQNCGLKTAKYKPSQYTSVHFVIRKNRTGIPTCEIQIRTILEEVWGELDHQLNYPVEISNEFKKDRIRVLAKIMRAGEKTIDLIVRDQ